MNAYAERVRAAGSVLWKEKAPLLQSLVVELTERCNNDCIHCCINRPADDADALAREMTAQEVQDILRQAANLGCLQVRFTGGEPLLRPDFEEIYLFARRLGMKVVLFTNARLITPEIADLFVRIPPREPVEVSVYGLRAGSYEAVSRVPGSYEQFRRGIELLIERIIPFVVKGALLPPNRGELGELEAWASGIPWMDGPPGISMFLQLRARRDDPEKNRAIQSMRLAAGEGLAVMTRDPEQYRRGMAGFCSGFLFPPGDDLFHCGACEGGCVDAYGRFQPCSSVRAPELTFDLGSGSLRQALLEFFPRLKSMKATNPDYLARCAVCFLKGLCEQCPARSWEEHGTLDAPVDYYCDIAHEQARQLGLIHEGESAWEVADYAERIAVFAGSITQVPGSQVTGSETAVLGSQVPGSQVPGSQVPGSKTLVPGSETAVAGLRVPGSKTLVPGSKMPVPGSQVPGSQVPG